jgi:hypothetical protein
MASGFQNNQDQLTPNYYRVQIDLSSGYSSTSTDNDSGGVEAWDFTNFNTMNTTADNSRRRARGNVRFNNILNQLQLFANVQILDMTVLTGGNPQEAADDVATGVAFTVGYVQEAYVYGGWQNTVGSGTFSDGSTTFPPVNITFDQLGEIVDLEAIEVCIKEAIVRGITTGGSDGYTRRYKTYNPADNNHREEQITVTQPKAPADVWNDVTVSAIQTMTQITTDN